MELTELGSLLGVPELPEAIGQVDGVVSELLASADASLAEPCRRILRGRGKRLRPALVIAAASCGPRTPDRPRMLAAAAAVELMHIGSLVHDDIMDAAEQRRGVASINFQEGSHSALLCGDVLFALSGHAASRVGRRAAIECAETIVSLCNGQIREKLDDFNPDRSEPAILDAIEGKTAALLRTACRIGGRCGGLDAPAIDALASYGTAFGMAFQLVDDVLDFVSTSVLSGKPVLNDLRCGVYTMPVALALGDENGRDLRRALEPASAPLTNGSSACDRRLTDAQVEAAAHIVRSGDFLPRVLDMAVEHASRAADHLSVLPQGHPVVRGLARLPTAYLDRQLTAVANQTLSGAEWLLSRTDHSTDRAANDWA